MTPPLRAFLERLGRIDGMRAAAFDTRLDWPLWLSGSAAKQIAAGLVQAGATVVAAPESFIVTREPKLRDGELERAAAWAESLLVGAVLAHV